MMPLWITATRPVQSRCGCALRSVGAPWVAQRVWPIADRTRRRRPSSASAASSSASLPARLTTVEAAVEHGDARRVVPAVLEPAETFDDDREGLVGPHVAHDAAHERSSLAQGRCRPEPGSSGQRRGVRTASAIASAWARASSSVRRLDHDPDQRLGAGCAHQHAAVRRRARSSAADRVPDRSAAVQRVAVDDVDVHHAPAGSGASPMRARATDTPVRAASERNRTAVSRPSPVVACSPEDHVAGLLARRAPRPSAASPRGRSGRPPCVADDVDAARRASRGGTRGSP